MARIIRMPSEEELPEGPHREFVEELRRYYRAAGRPALRQVSRAIDGRADLKEVTASQETVRRMLRGLVLPTDWSRVYAVFYVLCEMGSIDPEGERWEDSYEEESKQRSPQAVVGRCAGGDTESASDPPAAQASRAPEELIGLRRL